MAMEIDGIAEGGNDTVRLLSSDGKIFQVAKAVALQSEIISKVMEDFGTQNSIPLLEVNSEILEKVIEYCAYHVDHPPRSMETIDDIDPFDVEFLKVNGVTLTLIAKAAHYLDIKSLLALVCRKISQIIQSLETPERVREMFRIPNDLSPEEEEEIRRANQ